MIAAPHQPTTTNGSFDNSPLRSRQAAIGQIEPPDERPVFGFAGAERTVANPPFAAFQDRPYERAGSARKRTSEDGAAPAATFEPLPL
jgi:hypothetical protein